jgi:hypothetical protein
MNNSEFLYHYTSIETLALILKNRTIRFNNLCAVDDLQEQRTKDTQNFGKFIFVSCWTDYETESIPMWSMYANKNNLSGGVRIKSHKFPFRRNVMTKELENKYYGNDVFINNRPIATSLPENLFFKYFYFPGSQDVTLNKMLYTDEQEKLYPEVFSFTPETTMDDFQIDLGKMGKTKRTVWNFQYERRYILYASPFPMLIKNKTADNVIKEHNEILENIKIGIASLPLLYIDLSLDDYFFSQLEITLSPTRKESERLIAEALTEKYAPNAVIKESSLYGEIQ